MPAKARKRVYRDSKAKSDSIDKVRALFGLRKIESGDVVCLKCGVTFESEDKVGIRTCPACALSNENVINWGFVMFRRDKTSKKRT